MLTTIIIYLSIGIILISVGPLSKDLINEIKVTQPDNSKTYKIRKTLFTLTIIGVGILLYPIFYYSYFFQNGKKMSNFKPRVYEEGKLYFGQIPGIGNLICKDCSHTEIMTSFTHGLDAKTSKRTSYKGHQCLDCGKLHAIFSFEKEELKLINCECGGTMQRENPLFCPQCQSSNVQYHLKLMT